MAKALSNISCVEPFLVTEGENLHKRWLLWREELDIYIVAAGVTDKKQQKALLLHLGGREMREIYKTLKSDDDDYSAICEKLETYFQPRKNLIYERFQFKQARQREGETIPSYITRLRNLALHCEFNNLEEEVRDSVVSTCTSNRLKKKLLSEKNLTLEKVLSIGKEYEAVLSQVEEMDVKNSKDKNFETDDENVMRLKAGKYSNRRKFQPEDRKASRTCFNCGDNFTAGHMGVCIARGRKCFNCGKFDHLSKVCRSRKQTPNSQSLDQNNTTRENHHSNERKPPSNQRKSNVHNLQSESEHSSEEEIFSIQPHATVNNISNTKSKHVNVKIKGTKVKMLVDSGSSVTIMDKNTIRIFTSETTIHRIKEIENETFSIWRK